MRSLDEPTRPGAGLRGVLRIFFTASPLRAFGVIACLVAAGLAEGIGLATLLPVLVIAAGGTTGKSSALARGLDAAFHFVGLPNELPVLLVVVAGGLWIKAGLSTAAMHHVGSEVAAVATRLRLDLIERVLNARWTYYIRQPVGRFTNAISSEATRAGEAYQSAAQLISLMLQTLMYVVLSLLIDWRLTLISLAIGGFITLSLNKLVRSARKAGRNQTRRTQSLVQRLSDTLIGVKPLKAMAKHVRIGALFAVDARALNKAMRRQVIAKEAMRNLQEPLLGIFVCIGVYIAVVILALPITQFLVMALFLMKIVTSLNRAQQAYQIATVAESAFWSMRETIEEAAAAREPADGTLEPSFAQEVVFDRVTFSYDKKPVLRDVSFVVKAGEITTVTGASGAGKTTIVDLLLRLHRPDGGEIRIDGQPLGEMNLVRWREMMGYVPQEVILFHDSVLANITLGDPTLSRAEAQAALEAAGAWDFVQQMPQGFDSIVGERGALLSGGQRQRIAVARALIHQPAILILDEATSALDPETETAICRNLKDLVDKTGLTIIAISHRPAWVNAANRVYHLERSQVSEIAAEAPLEPAAP